MLNSEPPTARRALATGDPLPLWWAWPVGSWAATPTIPSTAVTITKAEGKPARVYWKPDDCPLLP